jgi:hypothetical protein
MPRLKLTPRLYNSIMYKRCLLRRCAFYNRQSDVNAAMQLPLHVGRVDAEYLKMLEKSLRKLL